METTPTRSTWPAAQIVHGLELLQRERALSPHPLRHRRSLLFYVFSFLAENAVEIYPTGGYMSCYSAEFWSTLPFALAARFLTPLPYNFKSIYQYKFMFFAWIKEGIKFGSEIGYASDAQAEL